jgi:hypothetical protein
MTRLLVGLRRSQSFSWYFPLGRGCSTLLLIRNRIRFCDQEALGLPTIGNPLQCEFMMGDLVSAKVRQFQSRSNSGCHIVTLWVACESARGPKSGETMN